MWGKAKEEMGQDNDITSLESPPTQKTPLLQRRKNQDMESRWTKHLANCSLPLALPIRFTSSLQGALDSDRQLANSSGSEPNIMKELRYKRNYVDKQMITNVKSSMRNISLITCGK